MKFGKRLKIYLEEALPESRDKFLEYKRLKKQLKLLQPAPHGFAEGAFIYANDAANSKVAQVDRQLRNGSEIGHYGAPAEVQRDMCRVSGVLDGLLEQGGGGSLVVVGQEEQQQEEAAAAAAGELPPQQQQPKQWDDASSDVDDDNGSISSSSPDRQQEKKVAAAAASSSSSSRKRRRPEAGSAGGDGFDASGFSTNHMFIELLMMELKKFNAFFIKKEYDYVMCLGELKGRTEAFKDRTAHKLRLSEEDVKEMTTICTDMITFHGEMVLLMNYSSLNYTGLVKILKKHDKQTGGMLRTPFIQFVLRQPFYTTELLSQLVSDCETNLSSLFQPQPGGAAAAAAQARSSSEQAGAADSSSAVHTPDTETHGRAHSPTSEEVATAGPGEQQQQQHESVAAAAAAADDASRAEDRLDGVYKGVVAALRTIKDIRRVSSTYTALSMPPLLELPDVDDDSLGDVIDERVPAVVIRDSPRLRTAPVSVSQD